MSDETFLTRAHPVDLEIRGEDRRTVCGICVPYDSPAEIREMGRTFTETVVRGAFERTIRERGDRVKFLAHHDQLRMPLGRAVLLREDAAGLYGEFKVSRTQAGDEALELIRDGALDSFSVGFRVVRDTWSRNRSERTLNEVALREVSAVNFPAYADASILGVRQQILKTIPREDARRRAYEAMYGKKY